jgi:hypothetical protein
MSNSTDALHPATLPPAEVRANRLKLLLLLGVFAAPMVVGTLLYWFWEPSQTGNHGSLLQPPPNIHAESARQILPNDSAANAATMSPAPFALKSMHGKWFILMSGDRACAVNAGGVCAERIEMTRKLKTLLGKHQNRLNRVVVFSNPPVSLVGIDRDQITFLTPAGGPEMPVTQRLLNDGHFFVVDPFGHVILQYAPDAEYRKVLRDLNRLMKYSPVG